MWLSLQFTHHCHNYTHLVSIYALLLRFMIFCHNLRTSVAIFAILSQFTHYCGNARDSAIYAFWEPKKTVNLGFRAKKQNFQPWVLGQGCHRVLVSLISWPGQLLSLNPCRRPKILARMLFFWILSFPVVILDITPYLIIVIIGENKPMHKKYNIPVLYCIEI